MPAKSKTVFICQECGFESSKWSGKCPECESWNSFVEEMKSAAPARNVIVTASLTPVSIRNMDIDTEERDTTGLSELDRVLGGGLVKGSVALIGGEPGIGKSTLLLQICETIGFTSKILYISGEESKGQIKMRAKRLGVNSENLFVITETDLDVICSVILSVNPDIVIIDSIQTMMCNDIASTPGSISQVRESASRLIRIAKSKNISFFLVGHVNKEGAIAGPKVLEHMVDTVLYFEGERHQVYRILRVIKNRYGPTNEIGVFEMGNKGITQVDNPSHMLISGRPRNVSGTCVVSVMEGSRPILAEIQALVTPSSFSSPRRTATGLDYNRVLMLLAVLEKKLGLSLSSLDTYVNVVGGIKLIEPDSDLGAALAVISSFKDKPIDEGLAAIGEIGLTGEVRSVSNINGRILEASRLGFKKCIIPKRSRVDHDLREKIEIYEVLNIREAVDIIF